MAEISILLADHTLLYELLDVIGHLGPKYSVPCPKEAVLLVLVAFMYMSHTGNDGHMAAATRGTSQCHS